MRFKNMSKKISTFVDSKLNIHSVGPGEIVELPDSEDFYIPNLVRLDETDSQQ